jgi:hypothetical protein
MSPHRRVFWMGLIGAVAAVILVLLAPRRIAPEHHLAPGRLSPVARSLLEGRMQRHGLAMENLSTRVVLLEYEQVVAAARDITDEAPLSRPLHGTDEINAQIPPRFFDLQDELRVQVRAMAEAARSRDAPALGEAYGRSVRTCVGCHQLYLEPR